MVAVELNNNTLSTLIAGIYCTNYEVDALAIPQSIWLEVAEKLEYFLPDWDYNKISFEEWVETCLLIMPKDFFTDEEIMEMQEESLYWERLNGNAVLIISMDIRSIN